MENIGALPFQKREGDIYYTLRSVFSTSGELIYIPVDAAVLMRPLIGGREASDYLDRIPGLEPKAFSSRKPAELSTLSSYWWGRPTHGRRYSYNKRLGRHRTGRCFFGPRLGCRRTSP